MDFETFKIYIQMLGLGDFNDNDLLEMHNEFKQKYSGGSMLQTQQGMVEVSKKKKKEIALERKRLEEERLERERLKRERLKRERLERERLKKEQERINKVEKSRSDTARILDGMISVYVNDSGLKTYTDSHKVKYADGNFYLSTSGAGFGKMAYFKNTNTEARSQLKSKITDMFEELGSKVGIRVNYGKTDTFKASDFIDKKTSSFMKPDDVYGLLATAKHEVNEIAEDLKLMPKVERKAKLLRKKFQSVETGGDHKKDELYEALGILKIDEWLRGLEEPPGVVAVEWDPDNTYADKLRTLDNYEREINNAMWMIENAHNLSSSLEDIKKVGIENAFKYELALRNAEKYAKISREKYKELEDANLITDLLQETLTNYDQYFGKKVDKSLKLRRLKHIKEQFKRLNNALEYKEMTDLLIEEIQFNIEYMRVQKEVALPALKEAVKIGKQCKEQMEVCDDLVERAKEFNQKLSDPLVGVDQSSVEDEFKSLKNDFEIDLPDVPVGKIKRSVSVSESSDYDDDEFEENDNDQVVIQIQ